MSIDKIEIVALILPKYRDRLAAIATELSAAGVANIETSVRFGLIMGVADPNTLDALVRVKGVQAVRRSQDFMLQGGHQ